jgi:hypothetical protein
VRSCFSTRGQNARRIRRSLKTRTPRWHRARQRGVDWAIPDYEIGNRSILA